MKIAIMMLTYNRKSYIEKTLSSYERQIGDDERFQFIVLDNGSSDETPAYLAKYDGPLSIEVVTLPENIGVSEGTKYLLKNKCFGSGFDFIIRADDDELLADGWPQIFDHWDEFVNIGAVVVGFRRTGNKNYFEGFKWIARNQGYTQKLTIGPFECYRSDMAPGFQMSKEEWWEKAYPTLTDYGQLYGGWDYTLMEALINFGKSCLVVWNYESLHIQTIEDYEHLEEFKQNNLAEVHKKINIAEDERKKVLITKIEELRKNPTPEGLAILKKTNELMKGWNS